LSKRLFPREAGIATADALRRIAPCNFLLADGEPLTADLL